MKLAQTECSPFPAVESFKVWSLGFTAAEAAALRRAAKIADAARDAILERWPNAESSDTAMDLARICFATETLFGDDRLARVVDLPADVTG